MALVTSGRLRACPACGAADGACTSPGHRDEDDIINLIDEEIDMSEEREPLQVYDVNYNGFPTRMKLSKADAKRLNGTLINDDVGQDAVNDANHAAVTAAAPTPAKARTAPNKQQ